MVIRVLDFVRQCYSDDDGIVIYDKIKNVLDDDVVTISFEGVDIVTTSFVNNALLPLTKIMDFDTIKKRIKIVNTNKAINEVIKKRFLFVTRPA